MDGKIIRIQIKDIAPNKSQPRKNFDETTLQKLADSISQYGILQPLTVRNVGESYELIAGERRLRAAAVAGLDRVPCICVDADDRSSAELALIENLQREDLNIFEQAGAIAALIDLHNLTQEQVSAQLSVSQSYIANKLRILRLTDSERELILRFNLTERHARALLRIIDTAEREKALRFIISHEMNVASTENYVDRILANEAEEKRRRNSRIIIKDIRLFYNTVDHAVDIMRQAGVNVACDRRESGESVELIIRIPNQYVSADA